MPRSESFFIANITSVVCLLDQTILLQQNIKAAQYICPNISIMDILCKTMPHTVIQTVIQHIKKPPNLCQWMHFAMSNIDGLNISKVLLEQYPTHDWKQSLSYGSSSTQTDLLNPPLFFLYIEQPQFDNHSLDQLQHVMGVLGVEQARTMIQDDQTSFLSSFLFDCILMNNTLNIRKKVDFLNQYIETLGEDILFLVNNKFSVTSQPDDVLYHCIEVLIMLGLLEHFDKNIDPLLASHFKNRHPIHQSRGLLLDALSPNVRNTFLESNKLNYDDQETIWVAHQTTGNHVRYRLMTIKSCCIPSKLRLPSQQINAFLYAKTIDSQYFSTHISHVEMYSSPLSSARSMGLGKELMIRARTNIVFNDPLMKITNVFRALFNNTLTPENLLTHKKMQYFYPSDTSRYNNDVDKKYHVETSFMVDGVKEDDGVISIDFKLNMRQPLLSKICQKDVFTELALTYRSNQPEDEFYSSIIAKIPPMYQHDHQDDIKKIQTLLTKVFGTGSNLSGVINVDHESMFFSEICSVPSIKNSHIHIKSDVSAEQGTLKCQLNIDFDHVLKAPQLNDRMSHSLTLDITPSTTKDALMGLIKAEIEHVSTQHVDSLIQKSNREIQIINDRPALKSHGYRVFYHFNNLYLVKNNRIIEKKTCCF